MAEDNLVSLARFYRIANNRLWQIAQTKGQTWVLRMNGSANAPFFYEGEMCVTAMEDQDEAGEELSRGQRETDGAAVLRDFRW